MTHHKTNKTSCTNEESDKAPPKAPLKIAIIGGGLAGCALAYTLKKNGAIPVIYEANSALASGASGHSTGLYNPRLSALRDSQSDFFTAAFALALRIFPTLENIDWNPCGCLHLITDERQEKRFPQTIKNWKWDNQHMQILSKKEASNIAGIPIKHDALYLPDAGSLSPAKLCHAYTKDIEIHLNHPIKNLKTLKQADAIILACGYESKTYAPWLPMTQVRGQLTEVQATPLSKKLKCALCYGGYISPADDGDTHALGATFQRHFDNDKPTTQDNKDNIQKLAESLPSLAKNLKVTGHRAAIRTMTTDYFPVIGKLPQTPETPNNLYISTAHGSYGIISTLISAHLLTDMILGQPFSLPRDTLKALSPDRFRKTEPETNI